MSSPRVRYHKLGKRKILTATVHLPADLANKSEDEKHSFIRGYPGPYTVDVKRDGERNWTYKKGNNVALINKYSTVYLPPASPLRKDFANTQNVLTLSKTLEQDILKSLGEHDGIFDTEYMTKDDDLQTLAKQRHNRATRNYNWYFKC